LCQEENSGEKTHVFVVVGNEVVIFDFSILLSSIVISRNEYQRACNITLGQLQRMGM
jgi:hypothetical protein